MPDCLKKNDVQFSAVVRDFPNSKDLEWSQLTNEISMDNFWKLSGKKKEMIKPLGTCKHLSFHTSKAISTTLISQYKPIFFDLW